MKVSKKTLLRIIREEATKSTKKYDDDSALKGDQDELPDALQKGIIDKAVEDREEKNESIRFTMSELRRVLMEEMALAQKQPQALDADSLSDLIVDLVGDELTGGVDDGRVMGHGGSASMAKQQLQHLASNAQSLHDSLSDEDELPEWAQSKIAVAEAGIDSVYDHLSYKMQVQESSKKKVRRKLLEQDDDKMSSSEFVAAMKGDIAGMMKIVPDAMNDELMGAIKALVAASKFDTSAFKTVIGLVMDKTAKAQEKASKEAEK
tara:strand:+ start:4549 stop:5337 length:789 start_codon:yes stop_codon:yes gene_type:complete